MKEHGSSGASRVSCRAFDATVAADACRAVALVGGFFFDFDRRRRPRRGRGERRESLVRASSELSRTCTQAPSLIRGASRVQVLVGAPAWRFVVSQGSSCCAVGRRCLRHRRTLAEFGRDRTAVGGESRNNVDADAERNKEWLDRGPVKNRLAPKPKTPPEHWRAVRGPTCPRGSPRLVWRDA